MELRLVSCLSFLFPFCRVFFKLNNVMPKTGASSSKRAKIVYNKDGLSKIIKHENDRIGTEPNCRKEEYKCFKRVFVDGVQTDFLICETCDDWNPIYHVKGSGTGCLINHVSTYHKVATSKSIQTKVPQYVMNEVSKEDKRAIADSIAFFCASDLRPFHIVEGQGFIDMIQAIIKLASVKGQMDAAKLLPTADTVKNHLNTLDKNMRTNLRNHLLSIPSINATTDHWKDDYVGQSYMTITIHYIDNSSFKIQSRVIGTFAVENKTAAVTLSEFNQHLDDFDIKSKLRVVVTDNFQAMKSAFKSHDWIGCSAHNLSLVHKHAYGEPDGSNTEIEALIEASKSLVTYVKQSGRNRELEHRLKQQTESRWDSHYDMLQSILDSFEELLRMPGVTEYMNQINRGILAEFVAILKPMKDIRMELCIDDKPTVNLVAVSRAKIIKLLTNRTQGKLSDSILILKGRLKKKVEEYFIVTKYHMIATFLTPQFRNFPEKHSDKKLVDDAMEYLELLMEDEIPESENEAEDVNQNIEKSLFADYYDKPARATETGSELSRYRKIEFLSSDFNLCPIKFWTDNKASFPKLSNIALWLFAIPATSICSERSFSTAGNVITPHRSSLKPETVDKLLFVRSNVDMK